MTAVRRGDAQKLGLPGTPSSITSRKQEGGTEMAPDYDAPTPRSDGNEEEQKRDLARRALDELPPDKRELVVLSRYQGNLSSRKREVELAEYREGASNPELTAHLAVCAECQALVAIWEWLGVWRDETPDAGMPMRFRQRQKEAIKPKRQDWTKWAAVAAARVLSFLAGRTTSGDVTGLR